MMGRLVYVMGPSGSGKDTLLRQAREALAADSARICFAHRYITRPASLDAENHVALSPAEFLARRSAGLFALHWHSHGLDYAIGIEIDRWLASGMTVVVNGSRAHLPVARQRYPQLQAVLIHVSPKVQRDRLLLRGREDAAAIEARLARSTGLPIAGGNDARLIRNEGALQDATERLLQVLHEVQREAAQADISQHPALQA